jgi:hypothetical protein
METLYNGDNDYKGVAIIDCESKSGIRTFKRSIGATFEDAIQKFKNDHPIDAQLVVYYINADTGKALKGPKFGITKQKQREDIKKYMKPGINNQGVKSENMKMLKETFVKMVKEVIQEVKKNKEKPIPKDSEQEDRAYQGYRGGMGDTKKGNKSINEPTNDEIIRDLTKIAQKANKDAQVFFDDHKDFRVEIKNQFSTRINKKFTNNFDIEAFKNDADRIYAIGLTLDQVKDFVKVNLDKLEEPNSVGVAHKKSLDNLEDKTKAKPPVKTEPIKNKEVAKKDKEELPEKEEDKPDQPLKAVEDDEVKKQRDFKAEKPPASVSDKATGYKKPVTKFKNSQ